MVGNELKVVSRTLVQRAWGRFISLSNMACTVNTRWKMSHMRSIKPTQMTSEAMLVLRPASSVASISRGTARMAATTSKPTIMASTYDPVAGDQFEQTFQVGLFVAHLLGDQPQVKAAQEQADDRKPEKDGKPHQLIVDGQDRWRSQGRIGGGV